MRLAIIINPASGRGRSYKRLRRYLSTWPHRGWRVDVHETKGPGHAGEIAVALVRDAPDLVAVYGGDGTIREVATSVPSPPYPVAVLPGGTANVLAKEIGVHPDPIRALDACLDGTVKRVDLGVAQERVSRRFLLMIGVGLDAYIVSRVPFQMKRRWGMAAFYVETLRGLIDYPFREFEVSLANRTMKSVSCIVSNARGYGGGLVLTTDAELNDGALSIVNFNSGSRLDFVRYVFAAWLGLSVSFPWVERIKSTSVRVEGSSGLFVQADGDLIGPLPIDIGITSSTFPLIVPKARART